VAGMICQALTIGGGIVRFSLQMSYEDGLAADVVGPDRSCLPMPPHPPHCRPSFLDFDGIT